MLGTRLISLTFVEVKHGYQHGTYGHAHYHGNGRYYYSPVGVQSPPRLSWKEEAKRPWLKPKPEAKEISSNLYTLLARSN